MERTRLRILFSGMVAGDPCQGGATWAVLQYVLGLRRLGHDVYFVEPIRRSSISPSGASLADSVNGRYFNDVVSAFGLMDRATLLLEETRETVGVGYSRLSELARRVDLLINVSGMLTDARLLDPIPTRVYLDLDPAFIQLWDASGIDMRFASHSHFITVGTRVGEVRCDVPTCGRRWMHTLQPVVLAEWPAARHVERDAFTTVANWRGYGSVQHNGVFYGQKAHSLRRFIELPRLTGERFELALAIHPDEKRDLEALAANGWSLVDPKRVAGTPDQYRAFVRGSRAELGIAKSGYVESRCGWFSDRSACYLASGRPVVAQETGFSDVLPVGHGLFSFETADDVRAAAESLRRNYTREARAARDLAEAYFDSDRVLTRLLDAIGGADAAAA